MSIATVIVQPGGVGTVVTAGAVQHAVAPGGGAQRWAVTAVAQGLRGARGEAGASGAAASLSADAGNRTVLGADGGMYTPELGVDPLAHYILAKN